MNIQSTGKTVKDFCPDFLQPPLENVGSSCNGGSRKLIPVFHGPLLKSWCFPPAMILILQCHRSLRRVGEEKKQFGPTSNRPVNILDAKRSEKAYVLYSKSFHLTSSAKSSVRALRASWRSFIMYRNEGVLSRSPAGHNWASEQSPKVLHRCVLSRPVQ